MNKGLKKILLAAAVILTTTTNINGIGGYISEYKAAAAVKKKYFIQWVILTYTR